MVPPHQAGQGLSYFNRFIEEMERKYSAQHVHDVGDDSDEGDDFVVEDGADGDNSSDSEGEGDDAGSKTSKVDGVASGGEGAPKKKRNRAGDFYDDDDGFIDDSDVHDQVGVQLEAKQKMTKHSGFFVSMGELELLPDPTAPILERPKPTRKEKAGKAAGKRELVWRH